MVTKEDICKAITGHNRNYKEVKEKLGYKHIQSVYNWPTEFSGRQLQTVVSRMRQSGIVVPAEWGV